MNLRLGPLISYWLISYCTTLTLRLLAVAWVASFASADESRAERVVRVAAISFHPEKLALERNADELERWFRKAAAGGAELAVGPEGALDGYPVNEIVAGELPPERLAEVAVTIDSPEIERFRRLARELGMCLVFGFAEQIGEDIFNTAIFIDDSGQICGKYHKMQFAEGYDDAWWFNRLGARSRAFDTPLGRCGILICNDRWNPQLAQIPALDGAQLLIIPSFGSTSAAQDEAVLARGKETGLPVVEANVGVSLIVDHGEVVALDRKTEGIVFGDIEIPGVRQPDPDARDAVEREFLAWRVGEMERRLQKRRARESESGDH